ncbi:hypothetical protein PSTEL_09610 [Paenibacillus stellifer]|uniref:Uncharacterized protein n=1 Tax=Paenibacillus stellifer TaxID=169760 RepID=A0A089LT75_9BACL|nr:hypothetical protein [Paenibacillus stellifer]AIQ63305.1 hypothetical protein PSTEL_09610 [Paenibacillus stellifer]
MLSDLKVKVTMPDWFEGLMEGFEKAKEQGMPEEFGELVSQYISEQAVEKGCVKFEMDGSTDA